MSRLESQGIDTSVARKLVQSAELFDDGEIGSSAFDRDSLNYFLRTARTRASMIVLYMVDD